jgi:hypothetical protein
LYRRGACFLASFFLFWLAACSCARTYDTPPTNVMLQAMPPTSWQATKIINIYYMMKRKPNKPTHEVLRSKPTAQPCDSSPATTVPTRDALLRVHSTTHQPGYITHHRRRRLSRSSSSSSSSSLVRSVRSRIIIIARSDGTMMHDERDIVARNKTATTICCR